MIFSSRSRPFSAFFRFMQCHRCLQQKLLLQCSSRGDGRKGKKKQKWRLNSSTRRMDKLPIENFRIRSSSFVLLLLDLEHSTNETVPSTKLSAQFNSRCLGLAIVVALSHGVRNSFASTPHVHQINCLRQINAEKWQRQRDKNHSEFLISLFIFAARSTHSCDKVKWRSVAAMTKGKSLTISERGNRCENEYMRTSHMGYGIWRSCAKFCWVINNNKINKMNKKV